MEKKHTRLGVASFALAVFAALGSMGMIVFAGIVKEAVRGDPHDYPVVRILFFLGMFAMFVMNLGSLGLGIAGLMQTEQKKVFAVLGTVFASMQVLGVMLVVLASAN